MSVTFLQINEFYGIFICNYNFFMAADAGNRVWEALSHQGPGTGGVGVSVDQ
jgi:hypothetical protein